MGRPAARQSDNCSGHGSYPPRAPSSCSPNVFINGVPAQRKGDPYFPHCVGPSCHLGANAKGSGTVFTNGQDAMRLGDPVDCGSVIAQGSTNVFIGA